MNHEAVTNETYSISNLCLSDDANATTPNGLAHFEIGSSPIDVLMMKCDANIFSKTYFTAFESGTQLEYCKDQYTIIYVNESAGYLRLQALCQKVQGFILSEVDISMYMNEIKNIDEKCMTDNILTWLQTDNQLDFNSWCYVLLNNGTIEIRPCHRPLKCNLCKIKAALQVTLFGELQEFDKNYTVKRTEKGELYLKGHENSLISEVDDRWILRSSLLEFTCIANDSALPFTRLDWNCESSTKLLTFSPCLLEEFACDDGECRPEIERCNGVTDCQDSSDEDSCNQLRRDQGYDVEQFPPLPAGNSTLTMWYKFTVYSIADVKTSNFYADIDIGVEFEWHDQRLELWDPPETVEEISCSQIWYPKLLAVDSFEEGFLVLIPDDLPSRCKVKIEDMSSLKKMYEDPHMGAYCNNLIFDYIF